MGLNTSRSIPNLAADAMGQLAKLIGNEFDLARAELSAKAGQAGRAIAMIGAGAVILIPALVILLLAAANGLIHAGFSDPIAYLIVGGAAVLVALVLVIAGVSQLSPSELKPSATLEQVQRDKLAIKEMTR